MTRFSLALFISIAVLTAGCTIAPVRYVPVATVSTATPTPAPVEQQTVVVVPETVYVQQPLFYSPIIGIAAGYFIWRGLSGGRHGGHHHHR